MGAISAVPSSANLKPFQVFRSRFQGVKWLLEKGNVPSMRRSLSGDLPLEGRYAFEASDELSIS
jgi:hypothetical protein